MHRSVLTFKHHGIASRKHFFGFLSAAAATVVMAPPLRKFPSCGDPQWVVAINIVTWGWFIIGFTTLMVGQTMP